MQPLTVSLIGVSISAASLILSAAAFRYARAKHLAGYPYIEARRDNGTEPTHVYWSIAGAERKDWEVTQIKAVGRVRLAHVEYKQDGSGGLSPKPFDHWPLVQRLDSPATPIIATPNEVPGQLIFYLRSKANPSMRSRRRVDVNALLRD